MPKVQETVQQLFARAPSNSVNLDEDVAIYSTPFSHGPRNPDHTRIVAFTRVGNGLLWLLHLPPV